MKKYVIPAALAGILFGLTLLHGKVMAQEAAEVPGVEMNAPEAETEGEEDTVAPPTRAELVGEEYRKLKIDQFDGMVEDQLYPRVREVAVAAMEALDDAEVTAGETDRMKGILLDLYPLLRKGVYYYDPSRPERGEMAETAVDVHLNPHMSNALIKEDPNVLAQLVVVASTKAYNTQDFSKALKYFDEYMRLGAKDHRETVALFMAQASLRTEDFSRTPVVVKATEEYPGNMNLLMLALQMALDGGYNDLLDPMLAKALEIRPNDEQLLNVKAQLTEKKGNFSEALGYWLQLADMKPNNLGITRHAALCYYNLGAEFYNKSIVERDEKAAKKYERQSTAYFQTGQQMLEDVLANSPTDTRVLRALAITYGNLGNTKGLEEVNVRLQALGEKPMAVNAMPETITFDGNAVVAQGGDVKGAAAEQKADAPAFQDFARSYVEPRLADWTKRGEYEKLADYEKRINASSVSARYRELCKEAEKEYLSRYANRLRISDMQLGRYDADNETYRIESSYGPIVVKVPLKNKEAEAFKSSWESVKLNNPVFFIQDNEVAIASVELVTNAGKTYAYNSDRAADYDYTDVQLDLPSFIKSGDGSDGNVAPAQGKTKVLRAASDVDTNIPVTSRVASNRVALVMSNENYKRLAQVESALHDGEMVKEYFVKTLGIPEEQVLYFEDLTYAEMLSAVSRLKRLASALGPDTEVMVYYSGHGVPDETTREAYLLPVDADALNNEAAYSLTQFYHDLQQTGAKDVMVFLDACFSGMARDDNPLVKARGVAIKARNTEPGGDMFVLSATSGQETAMPYREKNHGMFTYYLLKKLQQTKGNVTLKELSDYVREQVARSSEIENHKPQTPTVTLSGRMRDGYADIKMRP